MRCCWGVDNLLPTDLIERLPRGMTYSYPGTVAADVLFVPGIEALRNVWGTIKNQDVAVIVFDTRVRLRHWSVQRLDTAKPLGPQLRSTNTVKYVAKNPIKRFLRKVTASFVSNFLTYSYKLRDPEKKAALQQQIFSALWQGKRQALADSTNKKSAELIALLSSPDAQNLERALAEIRSGRKIPAVAKAYSVAQFDINYVLKFLGKL
jgi:hypothetical protein